MYGAPHAELRARGTASGESGHPLKGIRVAVRQHGHHANTSNVVYDQDDGYADDTILKKGHVDIS